MKLQSLCWKRLWFSGSGHFWSRRNWSSKAHDPLRILFCGSEEFSIASLKALHKEQMERPTTIASIDVVCKPPKRVGRGLKARREVPIASVARELCLSLFQIDTFTRWSPPLHDNLPINLVIAVSFGLFVPPRILKAAKYGGLNVHPSMLPDFRGPAPLHHVLLAGETYTGVTLQTLHPERFDHGTILAQTQYPGFEIPKKGRCNVQELLEVSAGKGAGMLVHGIREGVFLPPFKQDSFSHAPGLGGIRHAPKITKEDSHVNWADWNGDQILRRERVLGPLWNMATIIDNGKPIKKRIIFTGITLAEDMNSVPVSVGVPFVRCKSKDATSTLKKGILHVKAGNGDLLAISNLKLEGHTTLPAVEASAGNDLFKLQPELFKNDRHYAYFVFRERLS